MSKYKGKKMVSDKECCITQTTRHRGSEEYRDEVLEAPYYDSFPDAKHMQEPAGEDGNWID